MVFRARAGGAAAPKGLARAGGAGEAAMVKRSRLISHSGSSFTSPARLAARSQPTRDGLDLRDPARLQSAVDGVVARNTGSIFDGNDPFGANALRGEASRGELPISANTGEDEWSPVPPLWRLDVLSVCTSTTFV